MVQNPDTQKKAQVAIDLVVGTERLPDFSDENSIPYIDALVVEVLRWRPALPLGMPLLDLDGPSDETVRCPAHARTR
jgi:cytochrome P450